MIGLLGKKLGMTHVYDTYGRRLAVTAIQAGPCTVTALREQERHGYQAVQLGFETVAEKATTKPQAGQFKKAGIGPFRYVSEFRLRKVPISAKAAKNDEAAPAPFTVGQQLTVELFKKNELVDVTGVSIGKGFQGGVRRWNWKGGPQTHGSMSHRSPGSIGSTTTPGRVVRGHHLPGHMGARRVTVQNARIVGLDLANNLLLVQGAVPGFEEQLVMVRKSVKKPGVIKETREFQVVVDETEGEGKKTVKAKKK
jgi:large subunit ribosomal protein L3